MSDALQYWEALVNDGITHIGKAEWELAESRLHEAERLCSRPDFPEQARCRLEILGHLARIAQRNGRYENAIRAQEEALQSDALDPMSKVNLTGELGVVYSLKGDHKAAMDLFREQYTLAIGYSIDMEAQACRAAGNLAMAMFQVHEQGEASDNSHLRGILELLQDGRIVRAQRLRRRLREWQGTTRSAFINQTYIWEAIGLARASSVHSALGETNAAIDSAWKGVQLTRNFHDTSIHAISRYFLGNAYLTAGRLREAKAEFNFATNGHTTVAIALCKQPSAEHARYLRKVVETGTDLRQYDEQGYNALDCAVYTGDQTMIDIVREGMTNDQAIGITKIDGYLGISMLRKHFRDIFHSSFRPILQEADSDCLQKLRLCFAQLLSQDFDKQQRFDELRLVSYADFKRYGRLPLFEGGNPITLTFSELHQRIDTIPFVVFMSYRWIGKSKNALDAAPDNAENFQYARMLDAVENLLESRPQIRTEDVYVWLDSACIDQDDIEPGRKLRGINALPLCIAQCDVMISIVDDTYFERAWCAVEILIFQVLRNSSNTNYQWLEHRLLSTDGSSKGCLRDGSEVVIQPSAKKITIETDRDLIRFLERQTMLLGQSVAQT